MTAPLTELANYISVLSRSAKETTRAEDRNAYTKHLAAAAQIFAHLHAHDVAAARSILEDERRSFGWGYLSGPAGEAVEKAFAQFAVLLARPL